MEETVLGARVLVIDDDSTCLTIVSAMLRKLGHEVVTTKSPSDALCTLRAKHELFGLVLSDVHMPQMSGIELQKQVAEEFAMPVVLMSGDDKKDLMLEALQSGAVFFIIKPIQVDDLKNLWQLAIAGRKGKTTISAEAGSACKDLVIENQLQDDSKYSASSSDPPKYERQCLKRKASNEVGGDENRTKDTHVQQKKQKVVWTISLHNRFLEAVEKIGFNKAVPKKILQHMKVPGLTRDHVASHLQKYRLFLKRASAESSSAEHERSWKERPLGSKFMASRRHLLVPNVQDEGLKAFAHQTINPRSAIGVPPNSLSQTGFNQLHECSNLSEFQQLVVTGTYNPVGPVSSNSETKGKELSSSLQLYGGNLADEATLQVQLPLQYLNIHNQCSDSQIVVGRANINTKQLEFVGTSLNGYHGNYTLEKVLNNIDPYTLQKDHKNAAQGENIPTLPGLGEQKNELEKHARCKSFDGFSFMQLLESGNDTAHGNFFYGLPIQGRGEGQMPKLDGYGEGPVDTFLQNVQKSSEESFEDFDDILSGFEGF